MIPRMCAGLIDEGCMLGGLAPRAKPRLLNSGGENATEVRYKQRWGTGFRREDEGNECPEE